MSDITVTAGESMILDFGPVEVVNYSTVPPTRTAVNLRLAGTRLHFIAKRSKADLDAAAEVEAHFEPGVTEANGIAVPTSGSNNNGTITVAGSVTSDLLDARYLPWELWLHEPSGRDSLIDSGTITVGRAVHRAAL